MRAAFGETPGAFFTYGSDSPAASACAMTSANESATSVAAFREGLSEIGYVEGRSVHMAFRWAEGHKDRLPVLAAELLSGGPKLQSMVEGIEDGFDAALFIGYHARAGTARATRKSQTAIPAAMASARAERM